MVDSSQTRLAYVAESAYGVTPTTPGFNEARFTGEGMNANIQTITSNEIRPDRSVSDVIQVGSSAGGNVDIELSYGSFDDWLESLMYSTWSSDVLKNGTTEKSFTIEKTFEAGSTDQYHRFTGCVADTLSLAMQSQQIVTGSFGFLAKGMSTAQAEVTGATYTGANNNPVINATTDFASLSITGASGIELTSLNLNISNNLRQQQVIGSTENRGIGTGRFEVTGDLTAYFEDASLYDLFLNGTEADLTFKLGGTSTKNYTFEIAKLKFQTGELNAGANDTDVLINLSFQGIFDGTDNTLKITRTP